jgi:Ala-tRNA(Pro) deacylase
MAATEPSTERGVALVSAYLREAGIAHDVVEHQPTYSAIQEARAAREEPRHTAKTLLLHDRDGWRLAVIPANRRLDMAKARRLLGGTTHLRLASEAEMREVFPAFDVGALPPVGPQLPLPEAVDVRLIYRDHVLCAGGDHEHAVRLDPRDLIRVAEPRVGDLCEHEGGERRKDFAELPKV